MVDVAFATWPWQVPEEEKDLGSQDRLIHVYHFTRDASQNHMVMNFFLLTLIWLLRTCP